MSHPVQEIIELTERYKAALQEVTDAQIEHNQLVAVCKEMNIQPPPGAFVVVNRRLRLARELSNALFFKLQDLGRAVGQHGKDGAQ
jgi:hypothetical protein